MAAKEHVKAHMPSKIKKNKLINLLKKHHVENLKNPWFFIISFWIFSQIKSIIMSYGKNLTGEKRGKFTSLDVTGQLNIDS